MKRELNPYRADALFGLMDAGWNKAIDAVNLVARNWEQEGKVMESQIIKELLIEIGKMKEAQK